MPRKKKGATIFEGRLDKEELSAEKEEFLEPEEHSEPHEEQEVKIHVGEKEADVYTAEGREELTEDEGQLAPWEEGFSEGAEEKGEQGTCSHCNKPLGDREEVVEREISGEMKWFCSDTCAAKCEAKHKAK